MSPFPMHSSQYSQKANSPQTKNKSTFNRPNFFLTVSHETNKPTSANQKTKQKQSKAKQMHKRIQTTRSDKQNKRSPESVCFTGNFGSSAFFTDGGSDRGTAAAAPALEATWATRVETSSSSSSPKRANGLMIDISIAGISGDETNTLEP